MDCRQGGTVNVQRAPEASNRPDPTVAPGRESAAGRFRAEVIEGGHRGTVRAGCWGMRSSVTISLLACLGCSPQEDVDEMSWGSSSGGGSTDAGETMPVYGDVARVDRWTMVEPDEDPLAEHRPDEIVCPEGAYVVEGDALEVDTGRCNYFSAWQPAAFPVDSHGEVRLTMWHPWLTAEAPATAHVAVTVQGEVALELEVPIPGDPKVYDLTFTPPVPIDEGTRLGLHLHNHGANTWKFGALSVEP